MLKKLFNTVPYALNYAVPLLALFALVSFLAEDMEWWNVRAVAVTPTSEYTKEDSARFKDVVLGKDTSRVIMTCRVSEGQFYAGAGVHGIIRKNELRKLNIPFDGTLTRRSQTIRIK
jgi:hypothetical protein